MLTALVGLGADVDELAGMEMDVGFNAKDDEWEVSHVTLFRCTALQKQKENTRKRVWYRESVLLSLISGRMCE
eukprot:3197285-Rhodomonas_salina.3